IEQELIGAAVKCLTDPETVIPDHRSSRWQVMRRFEDFIEQNQGLPLYSSDVCAAVGVPERTLRQYCLDQLGMAPRRYLVLRRMSQARRVLQRGDGASVTEIAMDHGFSELGRFAVNYRRACSERAHRRRCATARPRTARNRCLRQSV